MQNINFQIIIQITALYLYVMFANKIVNICKLYTLMGVSICMRAYVCRGPSAVSALNMLRASPIHVVVTR